MTQNCKIATRIAEFPTRIKAEISDLSKTGEDPLDVFHRVDFRREWIHDVDGHQLSVRLSVVDQNQATDDLHLQATTHCGTKSGVNKRYQCCFSNFFHGLFT